MKNTPFHDANINCCDCDYPNPLINDWCRLFGEPIYFNVDNPKASKCDSCKEAIKAIKEQFEALMEKKYWEEYSEPWDG